MKTSRSSWVALASALWLSSQSVPAAESQSAASADTNAVSLELFEAPRGKDMVQPTYPRDELWNGREGWVAFNFMVDPVGKAYEITIFDSTGNEALENAAMRALEKSTFEPAKLAGRPLDASHEVKYIFRFADHSDFASPKFVSAYRKLLKALDANDRVTADAALSAMQVRNLYEDAYFNFGKFVYFTRWGSEVEQLAALKSAIADEKCPVYLPKPQFTVALNNLLNLQLRTKDFAGALETWETMQGACVEKKGLADWTKSVAEIKALREDDRSYAVPGVIGKSAWNYSLLKRNFRLHVTNGRLAEIKLRCAKKYVFFQYQPNLLYKVAPGAGQCGIEVIGDPGTKFDLIQS